MKKSWCDPDTDFMSIAFYRRGHVDPIPLRLLEKLTSEVQVNAYIQIRSKWTNEIVSNDKIYDIVRDLEIGCFNATITRCKKLDIDRNWECPMFEHVYMTYLYKVTSNLTEDVMSMVLSGALPASEFASMDINDIIDVDGIREVLDARKNVQYTKKYVKLYTCPKCKCVECELTKLQTRCSDEGSTFRLKCSQCRYTWFTSS
jgi:DNA-directed RNA polymerase subunit M/transcription elongation factor TFIIS